MAICNIAFSAILDIFIILVIFNIAIHIILNMLIILVILNIAISVILNNLIIWVILGGRKVCVGKIGFGGVKQRLRR